MAHIVTVAREYVAANLGLEGDELEEFVDSFILSWNEVKRDFAAQAESPDIAKVREINHRVRGILAAVQVPELSEINEAMNAAAKAGDIEGIKAGIARIID